MKLLNFIFTLIWVIIFLAIDLVFIVFWLPLILTDAYGRYKDWKPKTFKDQVAQNKYGKQEVKAVGFFEFLVFFSMQMTVALLGMKKPIHYYVITGKKPVQKHDGDYVYLLAWTWNYFKCGMSGNADK
jgi:short subunit fatty acids transporter